MYSLPFFTSERQRIRHAFEIVWYAFKVSRFTRCKSKYSSGNRFKLSSTSCDTSISKSRLRISQSPRMQAKCNAVAPDVLSVPQMFGQSSFRRQRISVAEDVALKVEIVMSMPGRPKTNFTREGSPDRMTVCRGVQPRGWRRLMREGEISSSLQKSSSSSCIRSRNWRQTFEHGWNHDSQQIYIDCDFLLRPMNLKISQFAW